MSAWVVIPCLLTLRDEFNQVSPNRDKGSDGTIGDASHTSSSDHTPDEDSDKLRNKDADHVNEVHALDIDSTGPWPYAGWFNDKIHMIIAEEKRRWEDPHDMCRLNYIIWDHKIYDKDNNWEPETYTATSDPHTGHAHFSGRYETQAENDTRPWGVAEEEMDQGTFIKYLAAGFNDPNVQKALLDIKITDYADPNSPQRQLTIRQWLGYSEGRGQVNTAIEATEKVGADVLHLAEMIQQHAAGIIEGGSGTVHAS